MNENKTKATDASVEDYITGLGNELRQSDARQLIEIMQSATGEKPTMWGSSMVGFGSYHYKYDSGREGDMMRVGFAARKPAVVLYGLTIADPNHPNHQLLDELGPHKTGKGCIYIKSMSDIDHAVLKRMTKAAFTTKP